MAHDGRSLGRGDAVAPSSEVLTLSWGRGRHGTLGNCGEERTLHRLAPPRWRQPCRPAIARFAVVSVTHSLSRPMQVRYSRGARDSWVPLAMVAGQMSSHRVVSRVSLSLRNLLRASTTVLHSAQRMVVC